MGGVSYEWTAEEVDEAGDIVDSDFADRLRDLDTTGRRVALVRQLGNDFDGITHREWAYVEGGRLPGEFSAGAAVPKRFLQEWERCLL